jgi:hypothetical protein
MIHLSPSFLTSILNPLILSFSPYFSPLSCLLLFLFLILLSSAYRILYKYRENHATSYIGTLERFTIFVDLL